FFGWYRDQTIGWLLIAGALIGTAVGTKLTTAYAVPALTVLLFYGLYRLRAGIVPRIGLLCAFGATALVFAAPWYAILYHFTGNPFFPMFNAIFKSPGWPLVNETFNSDEFGIGTSFLALLSLPLAFTFQTAKFGEAVFGGGIGS